MSDKQITEVRVYWDEQDPKNKGWAFQAFTDGVLRQSGPLEPYAETIEAAISEAILELDLECEPEDFDVVREEGGFACWTREDD